MRSFLNIRVVHKIRRGEWDKPEPVPDMNKSKWPHWGALRREAEEFWKHDGGWRISDHKKPFVQMVNEAFWNLVCCNRPFLRYRGTVAAAATSCLDQGEGIRDGHDIGNIAMAAACVTEKSEKSGVAHAEQEDDLTAEREQNLKRVAEALSATDLLCKMSWIHTCPNTWRH